MMILVISSSTRIRELKLVSLEKIMKQKIVIEVPLHCAKCKKKVLTICTTADGVTWVTLERKERDQVVIKGDEIDAAWITERLREKVSRYARLVSVSKIDE